MIISPIQEWFRITQKFWLNKEYYSQWGFEWHDWIDIATPIRTNLYSPIDWVIEIKNQGIKGYWICIVVTEICGESRRQTLLAHLDDVLVENWEMVKTGQHIGYTWNTGNSTWPHLHFSFRRVKSNWEVINSNNWYKGREDIFWKGWINQYLPSSY